MEDVNSLLLERELIISILIVAFSAICNAVMDKVNFHYEKSVFHDLNPKWWDPNRSWKFVKFIPFTKYRPDAWHLSKSLMIIFICLGIADNWWQFIIFGLVWNLVFNLFFNKLLAKK